MPSNKIIAIFIATVALLVLLLVMFILNTARAEMDHHECYETVNAIFEDDYAGRLHPPLTQSQILELNNICDSHLTTLDDIKEIVPQYWE